MFELFKIKDDDDDYIDIEHQVVMLLLCFIIDVNVREVKNIMKII